MSRGNHMAGTARGETPGIPADRRNAAEETPYWVPSAAGGIGIRPGA
jgi:hypothetical protein